MPVIHPKFCLSLCLTAFLLLSTGRFCSAQDASLQSAAGIVPSDPSSSLPDPPEPQNATDAAALTPSKPAEPENITLAGTPRRLLRDQKAIWTSPFHLRPMDAVWLLPLGAATGVLIGSGHDTMTWVININANDKKHFNTFSNAGVATLGVLPAGMYLWSLRNDAPQAHETGLLTGEALADSVAVSEALGLVFRRDRPTVNDAQGHFFSSSPTDSSFPSNHATAAWAMASVIGDEYPGWVTRTAVYGLAAGVSVSRVLADQHFPSDVLIGSATGWLIGHYIYRAHHNPGLNPFDPAPMTHYYGAIRQVPPQPSSTSVQPGIDVNLQPGAYAPPVPVAQRPPRLFDKDAD